MKVRGKIIKTFPMFWNIHIKYVTSKDLSTMIWKPKIFLKSIARMGATDIQVYNNLSVVNFQIYY